MYGYSFQNPVVYGDPDGREGQCLAALAGGPEAAVGCVAITAAVLYFGSKAAIETNKALSQSSSTPGNMLGAGTLSPAKTLDRAGAMTQARTAKLGAVNLDTSTLRALASGKPEVVAAIMGTIGNKEMLVSETAYAEFTSQVSASGRSDVVARAATILSFTTLVPDMPSARVAGLVETRSVGAADKRIFGTGDQLGITTLTSDAKFVRGAEAQGVPLNVIVHPPESW